MADTSERVLFVINEKPRDTLISRQMTAFMCPVSTQTGHLQAFRGFPQSPHSQFQIQCTERLLPDPLQFTIKNHPAIQQPMELFKLH